MKPFPYTCTCCPAYKCSATPQTDIVCNRFPTPVHTVLHTSTVLPHTDIVCNRFPTPVHAVLPRSAVLPHRQTLCATVSLHLYMMSYIQVQCYPTDRHCVQPFPHTCTCCPTYKCSATPQTLCVTRQSSSGTPTRRILKMEFVLS